MKGKHRSTMPRAASDHRAPSGRGMSSGGPKLYGGAKAGVQGGVAMDHKMGMKGGHKSKTSH